jgi:hypothetical protein
MTNAGHPSGFEPALVRVREHADDPGRWQLIGPLRYTRPSRGTGAEQYVVRSGFTTDFASIPAPFAWALPRYGLHTKAAILHDRLCVSEKFRFDSDEVFRDALRSSNVNWGRRWLLWTGVTWGSVHAGLRAVVKGTSDEPVTREQVRGSALVDGAGARAAMAPTPKAAPTWSRIRLAVAIPALLLLTLVILNGTAEPTRLLDRPTHSAWGWALVAVELFALTAAWSMAACAFALWKPSLLRPRCLPRAWALSMLLLPYLPIALAAAAAVFVYTAGGPLRRRIMRRRKMEPSAQSDLRQRRLERARDGFIK